MPVSSSPHAAAAAAAVLAATTPVVLVGRHVALRRDVDRAAAVLEEQSCCCSVVALLLDRPELGVAERARAVRVAADALGRWRRVGEVGLLRRRARSVGRVGGAVVVGERPRGRRRREHLLLLRRRRRVRLSVEGRSLRRCAEEARRRVLQLRLARDARGSADGERRALERARAHVPDAVARVLVREERLALGREVVDVVEGKLRARASVSRRERERDGEKGSTHRRADDRVPLLDLDAVETVDSDEELVPGLEAEAAAR